MSADNVVNFGNPYLTFVFKFRYFRLYRWYFDFWIFCAFGLSAYTHVVAL